MGPKIKSSLFSHWIVLTICGFLIAACGEDKTSEPAEVVAEAEVETQETLSFLDQVRLSTESVDGARISNADSEPENWMSNGRTYSEQRYSPLQKITDNTVADLGLAWSFSTNTTRGLEASPIVVDGVMYTTGSWSKVYALNAATGELLWTYDPEVPGGWARHACCDVVNRGVAVWKGKVYVGTIDGRLVALDATDGAVIWEINTIDKSKPYTITGAPRIVKGKVIIGNGGAELGVRGYFTAYDAETSELAWRFYTVPGDPSQPFEHAELEMASKTWTTEGKYWEIGGGGTVWDSMAYDPELDLLYVGTGNGSPWNREVRSPGGGDNLFLSSILAINPDSGELVWYYQTTPGDTWDYTATQHMILAELEIEGVVRKVIMQAPKNGFFYVLDRATGELLSADKYVTVTWAENVDLETGRPIESGARYENEPAVVLPSPSGGHNWHPMAFNPDTGLVYIPAIEMGGIYIPKGSWKPQKDSWNLGLDWIDYAAILEPLSFDDVPANGFLKAWDPVKREEVWSVPHIAHWNGGVLTTAGNLVFQGTGDGRFVAYNAKTGEALWTAPVMTGIVAPPVTYMVDGEQYVAVMAGWGGNVLSTANPAQSITDEYGNDGRLLVFKIGGKETLPILEAISVDIPEPPMIEATAEEIVLGSQHYAALCMVCHGPWAVSSGILPDLRRMTLETHDVFQNIVRDGLYEANGMPKFSEHISEEQARLIRAYIVHRANISRETAANIGMPDTDASDE